MSAVDVVGYHYKTADDENNAMKWLAEEVDKEVWNSEEQATFSNSAFRPSTTDKAPTVEGTGIGGSGSALEMGNTVIKSFVESRRGHVIYQPVIGSYYEGAQYSFKELVSARDPWSGWMHYDAGLLILAHISKFAVTGWENETNTAGIWRGVASASKASAVQGTTSNAVDGRGEGNVIKAYINDTLVATYEDSNPITSGRVAIGCGNSYTRFDNLAVTKIKGYAPYYREYIDNMETYDLTPQKNAKLVYNNKWSRTCANQGMFVYQRSVSNSTGTGASITYTFNGTGLEVLGYNKSTGGTVNVMVDGQSYKKDDALWNADNMCTAYQVSGLEDGEHTVTIEVASGSLAVDAIAVIGSIYNSDEINVTPKKGTETGLPEEELPKDLTEDVVPDISTPSPSPAAPTTAPTTTPTTKPQPIKTPSVRKGYSFKVKGASYVVTDASKKTVSYRKAANKKIKSAAIPATVKVKANGVVYSFRVTNISAKAFAGCTKLKKVIIGKNVVSIGKEAFSKAKALKKITIKTTTLKKVGKNAIKGIYKKAKISCGKKKLKAYKKLFNAKTGYKKSMKLTK